MFARCCQIRRLNPSAISTASYHILFDLQPLVLHGFQQRHIRREKHVHIFSTRLFDKSPWEVPTIAGNTAYADVDHTSEIVQTGGLFLHTSTR